MQEDRMENAVSSYKEARDTAGIQSRKNNGVHLYSFEDGADWTLLESEVVEELKKAARLLMCEVDGLNIEADAIRELLGNTNWACLKSAKQRVIDALTALEAARKEIKNG